MQEKFPDELIGLLANRTQLWAVALTALSPRTRAEILELAKAADHSAREVENALHKLVTGGVVVEHADGTFETTPDPFKSSARLAARTLSPHADRRRRQRRFVYKGQVVELPEDHDDLAAVLELISQSFTAGRQMTEQAVNAVLFEWHPDWATLRRLMVDFGFLARTGGSYWRPEP